MDDPILMDMMVFTKKVANAIKKVIPCTKVGVSVVGLEVPHAHIHLIPMNHVAEMNFSKPKLTISSSDMEEIAAKIKAHI